MSTDISFTTGVNQPSALTFERKTGDAAQAAMVDFTTDLRAPQLAVHDFWRAVAELFGARLSPCACFSIDRRGERLTFENQFGVTGVEGWRRFDVNRPTGCFAAIGPSGELVLVNGGKPEQFSQLGAFVDAIAERAAREVAA